MTGSHDLPTRGSAFPIEWGSVIARTGGVGKDSGLERIAEFIVFLRVFVSMGLEYLSAGMPLLADMNLPAIADVLIAAGCLVLFFKRARDGGKSGFVLLALVSFVLCLSFFRTGNDSLMTDLIIVVAVSCARPRRLCRAFAIGAMLSIAGVVLCSVAGLLPMRDVLPNGRLVFSYGFGHPNTPGAYLLAAVGAATYVCWDGKGWRVPLGLAVVASVFAKLALSSNSSAALLLFIAAVSLAGHSPLARRVTGLPPAIPVVLLIVVPTVLCAAMLLLTAAHDNFQGLAAVVDRMTHSRALFANAYYEANGGFTLLGRPMVSSPTTHSGVGFAGVDCAYSYMALAHGLVPLLAVAVSYVVRVVRVGGARIHPFLFWSLMVYAAYGVVENCPMFLYANYTMLALAARGEDDTSSRP